MSTCSALQLESVQEASDAPLWLRPSMEPKPCNISRTAFRRCFATLSKKQADQQQQADLVLLA